MIIKYKTGNKNIEYVKLTPAILNVYVLKEYASMVIVVKSNIYIQLSS